MLASSVLNDIFKYKYYRYIGGINEFRKCLAKVTPRGDAVKQKSLLLILFLRIRRECRKRGKETSPDFSLASG